MKTSRAIPHIVPTETVHERTARPLFGFKDASGTEVFLDDGTHLRRMVSIDGVVTWQELEPVGRTARAAAKARQVEQANSHAGAGR